MRIRGGRFLSTRSIRVPAALLPGVSIVLLGSLLPTRFTAPGLDLFPGSTAAMPAAPVLLPILNDGYDDYAVDWTDVAGAVTYTLEEDQDPGFPSPLGRYTGPDSSVLIMYQPLGTYWYRVRASGDGGDGPWSNVESVTVAWVLHPPSLGPIDNRDRDGDYVVGWSYVRHAQVYHLEQDNSSSFPAPAHLYVGPELSFTVSGQPPGAWFYRVRAEGSGGSSPWSNAAAVMAWPEGVCHLPLLWRSR